MEEIPSFVATHFVRHAHITPFVTTSRADRGGSNDMGRLTPVNMRVFLNAEALVNIAGKRLCHQSSVQTVRIMNEVVKAVSEEDPDLSFHMVPNCVLQGGYCREPKICGVYPYVKRYNPEEILHKIKFGE
jgi:hypothetical protein